MKLLIEKKDNKLLFSAYKKPIPTEQLNDTNIISIDKIIFEEEYIIQNEELIVSFLKTIILKSNLRTVLIKNNSIALLVLRLISKIDVINSLYFLEAKPIYYDIVAYLIDNSNIDYINCFSMPNFLFDRLNMVRDLKIDLRNKITSNSNFMTTNKLVTYSQIYYKKEIIIKEDMEKTDWENMDAFLSANTKLRVIELKKYSKEIIKSLMDVLIKHNISNIKIVIIQEDKETENLNKCIDLIKKYPSTLKQNVKIRYSDTYKKENAIKQINLSLIKAVVVFLIASSIFVFVLLKDSENRSLRSINDILSSENMGEDPFGNINYDVEDTDSYYEELNRIFSELLEINDETVGWLTVPNTEIDYPVVQASDNRFYLTHNFNRRWNHLGWIFMDYRIDARNLSQNNIIYGHRAPRTDLMFSTLRNVLDEEWYKDESNHIITFNTIDRKMNWQIFSIYTTRVTNDYLITDFISKENFLLFIERQKSRSIYDFDVPFREDDKILTLSTCFNNSNYRLVVQAKLIN